MKLLSWNIRHGGGTRLARIVEEITAYDADVIALTEYRSGPGKELRRLLDERGWGYCETTGPRNHENGIGVFSRMPVVCRRPYPAAPEHRVRWLDIDLPDGGFGVGILHVMAAGSSKKHPLNVAKVRFWEAVLAAAQERLGEPFLLLGDWNTGAHRVDETGKTFVCAEHFTKLSAMGWTDLWRHRHPGATEWTWYSTLKGGLRGNGFRLDHAFATPSLLSRVEACRYSHREREAGVSDHSMMIVEVTGRATRS